MEFSNIFNGPNKNRFFNSIQAIRPEARPAYLALVPLRQGLNRHPTFTTDDGEIYALIPGNRISGFDGDGNKVKSEELRNLITQHQVAGVITLGYEDDETIGRMVDQERKGVEDSASSPKEVFTQSYWEKNLKNVDRNKKALTAAAAQGWVDHEVDQAASMINGPVFGSLVTETSVKLVNINGEVDPNEIPDEYVEYFERTNYENRS